MIRARPPRADRQAAEDTVPTVWPLFWAFRIMVGLGFGFIG
jgi:cytochrome d ubiquinol oxidase subunit I